jgi:hypothetical protein
LKAALGHAQFEFFHDVSFAEWEGTDFTKNRPGAVDN